MKLEHLVVPESKEMLKHTDVKGTQEPTEKAPNGQSCNNANSLTELYFIETT